MVAGYERVAVSGESVVERTLHYQTDIFIILYVQRDFYFNRHLTLKMTTAQVVETSVTNSSLSKDYPHLDDHTKQIIQYFCCH